MANHIDKMSIRRSILLLVVTVVALAAGSSQAILLTLHDTGEGISQGQTDLNWTIQRPDGVSMMALSAEDPNGNWVTPDLPAHWISSVADGQSQVGMHIYSTTFTIGSEYDPTTAEISGSWWSDDVYSNNGIYLNGMLVSAFDGAFYSDPNPGDATFHITSSFVVGLNTLSFYVGNTGGPAGTLVQHLSGSVSAVPDAGSTLILFGSVMGLLGACRSRLG